MIRNRGGPRKKNQTKGVSSRGLSYTVAEDKVLCSAYLNVTRDPIVGTNQKSETYWERITNYYNTNTPGPARTTDSLISRWSTISKDTARFCGIKAEVDRRRQSGKTESDRIEDAVQQFRGLLGKPFQFLHCWQVLRNMRKWEDWVSGKKDDSTPNIEEGETERGSQGQAERDEEAYSGAAEIRRPIGRDRAKKRRSEGGQSSSSSACLELFERMAKNRELKHQQETVWAENSKNAQDRQLAVMEEHARMQREQLDFTRFLEENKIMLMDLGNCSEIARGYFLEIQQEIADKRRKQPRPSGSK